MSWTTVVWSMNAAACLTIGLLHLAIGIREKQRAHLLFSIGTVSIAAIAACELLMMHAQTPGQFGAVLRAAHVPVCTLVISIVLFVRVYFRAGRLWLAYGACGLRVLALILNFYFDPNLNYREITGLAHAAVWGGETISVAVGVANPWTRVGELSSLMFLAFVMDASITLWRRANAAERRRIMVINGSLGLFIILAAGHTALVHAGAVQSPYLISLAFLPIVVAMSHELCKDVVSSAQLAVQLRERDVDLRVSEQRMDEAAAAAEMGMWEWNILQGEIWATARHRALFGYSPAERLDLGRFLNALHPDDRDRVRQALRTTLATGGNFEREYRVVLPDGRTRWIVTRGRVELGHGGKPVRVRGVSLDNSDHKRAAAALQESEARFRMVADTAPVMIWMTDADNLGTFFNNGWLTFTGRTLEQESGNGWAECVHREDLDRCLEVCVGSFNARQSFTMEFRLRRWDGEYRWVLDTGVPRFELDGTFVGYTGSCIDITERRQTDELLRRERSFLREVIDIDPNLIFVKDRESRFTLVNQATADVYGMTVEDLIGKTHSDLSANAAEAEHFRRVDLEVMDTLQQRFIPEEQITDAEGNIRWLQTVKRPILDESGRASQLLGSATDITRRKKTELELERQRNELAHLSRVAMLGEMSGSLAHELNQPLTAILSNAQAAQRFLAGDPVDLGELRDILEDIVSDDTRAGEIIHGLHQLLRKGETQYEPVDLNEVVRDVIRLVRSDLVNGGITVTTDLASQLPVVSGDRVQLQQVLINLVVNGCDAMTDAGAAERRLVVRTVHEEAERVRVTVVDNGRGIPPGDMERVFEPFYTTKENGLGLGLAVCRTIISSQGGHLWGANNATGGASFHFTMPCSPNVEPG